MDGAFWGKGENDLQVLCTTVILNVLMMCAYVVINMFFSL
jgi:hypothetical protein